jgi:hypothetical protein
MNTPNATSPAKSLLLDRIRDKIRLKHYSIRNETAYVDWIRRFILSDTCSEAEGPGMRDRRTHNFKTFPHPPLRAGLSRKGRQKKRSIA